MKRFKYFAPLAMSLALVLGVYVPVTGTVYATAEKIDICHKEGNAWKYMETPSGSSLDGHMGHGDFLFDGSSELSKEAKNEWCMENAPEDEENNDEEDSAWIEVIKRVINDDGGTAEVSDFTLYIEGGEETVTVTSGSLTEVLPGTYFVSEEEAEGYEKSYDGKCYPDGNLTLAVGETKRCVIVNNDVEPEQPVDVCPNILENQAEVPAGMHKDEQGNCVEDVELPACSDGWDNDDDGLEDYGNDPGCSSPEDNDETDVSTTDLCPNDIGVQETTPCPSDDVCPNDAGIQTRVEDCTPPPTTQCSDGVDNADEEDELVDLDDPGCIDASDDDESNTVEETTPTETPTNNSRRRGGGGTFIVGQVLGAQTGEVLGDSCGLYLDKFIRRGRTNDTEQVTKLQTFLNKHMNSGLPVTGFYGPLTEAAVKAFQDKYAKDVLTPWGLNAPTGIVYQTTLRWINLIECPELSLQLPSLIEWSRNPNTGLPVYSAALGSAQ